MKKIFRSFVLILSLIFFLQHEVNAGYSTQFSVLQKQRKIRRIKSKIDTLQNSYDNCEDYQEDNEYLKDALKNVLRSTDYEGNMFDALDKINAAAKRAERLDDGDSDRVDALNSAYDLIYTGNIKCSTNGMPGLPNAASFSDCKKTPASTNACTFWQSDFERENVYRDKVLSSSGACHSKFEYYTKVGINGDVCQVVPIPKDWVAPAPLKKGAAAVEFADYLDCHSDGQEALREQVNKSCRGIERRLTKAERDLERESAKYDALREECENCDLEEAKRRLSKLYPGAFADDETLRAVEPGTGFRNVAEPLIAAGLGIGNIFLNKYNINKQSNLIDNYVNKYDTYLNHCATATNEVCLSPNQVIAPPYMMMNGLGNMGYGGLNGLAGLGAGAGINANLSAGVGLGGISPYGLNTYGFNPYGFNQLNNNPYAAYGAYGGGANTQMNMMLMQQRALAMQSMYAGNAYGGMPYNTQGLYYNGLFPNINTNAGAQINLGAGLGAGAYNPWSTLNPYAYSGMYGTGYTGLGNNAMYF